MGCQALLDMEIRIAAAARTSGSSSLAPHVDVPVMPLPPRPAFFFAFDFAGPFRPAAARPTERGIMDLLRGPVLL